MASLATTLLSYYCSVLVDQSTKYQPLVSHSTPLPHPPRLQSCSFMSPYAARTSSSIDSVCQSCTAAESTSASTSRSLCLIHLPLPPPHFSPLIHYATRLLYHTPSHPVSDYTTNIYCLDCAPVCLFHTLLSYAWTATLSLIYRSSLLELLTPCSDFFHFSTNRVLTSSLMLS